MNDEIVNVENICKSFSTVEVLHNISFGIRRGEILGIIGENGAGKSTMMKILSGVYELSSGQIFFEGKPVQIDSPQDAKKMGISIIPQEFNLINDLSVYNNVFLGSELLKKNGLLDKTTMKERTRELLASLEVELCPDAQIGDLSAAEKQMVEISKAIAFESRILIMDEPTCVLTSHEINILFNLMRRLKEKGLTIVYISHKLKEVKEICDRVMVLRDGNFVLDEEVDKISPEKMAQSMVGRELSQVFPEKVKPEGEIVFEVKNITVPDVIKNISFNLKKGEILGFGGLVGAGRTEVSEAIMGIRKISEGEIFINGKSLKIKNPEDAVKAGLSYLSEDRQGSGIITSFSVAHNTTLVSLPAYSDNPAQWIDKPGELETAEKYKNLFNLKAASLQTPLEFLSGGNQQKVSMSKSIDTKPMVLIVDEPTRGIDVSAKQEIYHFIHDLVQNNVSCIFISSEMEELIGMCHRVVVMKDGEVTGTLEDTKITEEGIMLLATGITEEDA
ncbi:MAG: sugar ABC transporter ATP-binding protein [Spirochaetes bacterium]|nr:MAG: sugar ABC transporter ATP-binding protein [Spirochaetota bacterium]